jgi:hypothetical protein
MEETATHTKPAAQPLEMQPWQNIMAENMHKAFMKEGTHGRAEKHQMILRTAVNVLNLREHLQLADLQASINEIIRINGEIQQELDSYKSWYKFFNRMGKNYSDLKEAYREGQGRIEATKWSKQVIQNIRPSKEDLQNVMAAI